MVKYVLPLLILVLSCSRSETELYEWRGPNRMGIYPDTGLLEQWPENGPRELWAVDGLGRGFGSPQFTEERFYITGEVDSLSLLHCFDLEGNKLWGHGSSFRRRRSRMGSRQDRCTCCASGRMSPR